MLDGNKIEFYRNKAKFSRSKLAHLTGIPQRTVESWCWGMAKATDPERIKKLADALGCNPIDLYDFTVEKDPVLIALGEAVECVPDTEIIRMLNKLTEEHKKKTS